MGLRPRILVVADEFRFLAEKHPHYLQHLLLLATQGRSLGMYLVLATQRLGSSINSDMRAVIDNRVALRCLEQGDSIDAIGSSKAASLPHIPGRAILGDQIFQVALADNPEQWVKAIQAASNIDKISQSSTFKYADYLQSVKLDGNSLQSTGKTNEPESSGQADWRVLPFPLPTQLDTKLGCSVTSTAVFEQQESGEIIPWHYGGQSLLLAFPSTGHLPDCIDLAVMLTTSSTQNADSSTQNLPNSAQNRDKANANVSKIPKALRTRIQTQYQPVIPTQPKPIFWLENQSLTTRIFILQQLLNQAEQDDFYCSASTPKPILRTTRNQNRLNCTTTAHS